MTAAQLSGPAIIAAAVLCLSACAATKPADSFKDEFSTEITGDGTKFFTYVRNFQRGTEPGKTLRKAVQARLDTTTYCRDGYLTLEHYQANGIARIRGECREGATDNDREQFPNQPRGSSD